MESQVQTPPILVQPKRPVPWPALIVTNLASLLVGLTLAKFFLVPPPPPQILPLTPTPTPLQQTEKLYQGQYFIVTLPSNYNTLSEPSGNEAVWEEVAFETGTGRFSVDVSRTEPTDIVDSQDGEISTPQIVDGIQAIIKKGFGGIAKSVYSWHAILAKDQKTYHIQLYTLNQDKINQLENEFTRILSTFKFISNSQSGLKTYSNSLYGFTFQYPSSLQVYPKNEIQKNESLLLAYIPVCDITNLLACIPYPNTAYPDTNFSGAGFSVNLLEDKKSQAACYSTGDLPSRSRKINAIDYIYIQGGGAGLGNSSSDDIYRTFQNGNCFEMLIRISTNSGDVNAPPGTVKSFSPAQQAQVQSDLFNILSTFKFLDKNPISPSPWKTYANTKYKYTFKYPNTWGIGAICEGDSQTDLVRFGSNLLNYPNTDCGTANIPSMIYAYTSKTPPQLLPNYARTFHQSRSVNEKVLNYNEFHIIDRSQAGSNSYLQFYVPLGNNYLVVETGAYESSINKDAFDSIYSTFKFTN